MNCKPYFMLFGDKSAQMHFFLKNLYKSYANYGSKLNFNYVLINCVLILIMH